MDEEQLIHYVQKYEELYDPRHKLYKDQNRRELIWRKIANKMKLQAHECKERWKKLRENYRKAMKLRLQQKSKGIKKLKPIKHAQIIAFINEKIDLDFEQDSVESTERHQNAGYSGRPETHVPLDPTDPLTQERTYETSRNDTVITFFTNLGETVKTFPVDVQIRVKREIFKVVNEAEEDVAINRLQARYGRSRNSDYGLDY